MADTFIYGEQVSSSKLTSILSGLRSQGTSILASLAAATDTTLAGFNRKLQAMNGRVQRANRAPSARTLVKFLVSDFLDIDQGLTTATLRADVQAAHLRERAVPATAIIQSTRFSTNIGTVEQLDKTATQFRVHTDDDGGQIPTGVFTIQLAQAAQLTFLVFDTVPMPSEPVITVEVSSDSIAYTPAQSVASDADRITAWLAPQSVRFVRLTIVPTHPDELSGSAFTFGVAGFTGSGTDYQLQSEIVTKSLTVFPQSGSARFVADVIAGVSYFLSLASGPYVEIHPGDTITVPGSAVLAPFSVGFVGTAWLDNNSGTTIASTPIALNAYVRPTVPNGFVYQVTVAGTLGSVEPVWPTTAGQTIISGGATLVTVVDGIINHVLSPSAYLHSLKITGDDNGQNVTPGIGLSFQDANIAKLTRRYVGVVAGQLRYIVNDTSLNVGQTFTISYQTGPSTLVCSLKVRLSSSDRSVTPVFTGASLEQL